MKWTRRNSSVNSYLAFFLAFQIGANCAPILADIFFYSYKAEFIRSLLSMGSKIEKVPWDVRKA